MTPEELAMQQLIAGVEDAERASAGTADGRARYVAAVAAIVRSVGGNVHIEKDADGARLIYAMPIPLELLAPLEMELAAQEAMGAI